MINIKKLFVFPLLLFSTIYSQETFRVMTYNILNYPLKISSTRNPYFKIVVSNVDPDIIVVQEMENFSGVTQFRQQVLDTNYSAGGFIDGNDTDNAIFYKNSIFDFLDNTPIRTNLRNISQLTMLHKSSGDTLLIYSVHLKASSGDLNEQRRLEEVTNLRDVTDQLHEGSYFIVLGDFNMYSSNEPAFQKLVDRSSSGYFIDPIGRSGNWNESITFRGIHTQSTRTQSLPDEGSTGGLDDRFDMILISQTVQDSGGITYIPESYTTYGNDGNHLDRGLNELPNAVVADSVAMALYYASDHLPVYADFMIQSITSIDQKYTSEIPDVFSLQQNYPNPFNPVTKISYTIPRSEKSSFVELKIFDILGRNVATLVSENKVPGIYQATWNASSHPSGVYFYSLSANGINLSKKMLLLK